MKFYLIETAYTTVDVSKIEAKNYENACDIAEQGAYNAGVQILLSAKEARQIVKKLKSLFKR